MTKERITEGLQKSLEQRKDPGKDKSRKTKKTGSNALRKALVVSISEYPPVLIDHCFENKGFDPTTAPEDVLKSETLLNEVLEVLQEAHRVVAEITGSEVAKGYIVARKAKDADTAGASRPEKLPPGLLYEDFQPFRPKQFEEDSGLSIIEFDGFNNTVDEFFSSIEGQRLESKLEEREATANRRLTAAREEHEKRLGGLQQVQHLNIRKAEAIEANVARVDEATVAVNGLLAQGMDWVDIARLIEQEQGRGNAVAQMIKLPLKLNENTITLLLGEAEADDDLDSVADKSDTESDTDNDNEEQTIRKPTDDLRLSIDIDLSLTAWANASQYYDQKKTAAEKEEKTLQSSSVALKSAERKIAADLKKGLTQEKDILRPIRKTFWFEKFHFFISSDGYLVLGGKDAQQNELLYRRYLKRGDIYVHADLSGAPSVIIKNNPSTPDAPIPPSTLSQAGGLAVCASNAWESKAVMAAWWVNADQVSKTAPTGEYITTGAFMIRGKKNFLPPAQLLMGFALLWQISDDSKFRHMKHRVQHTEDSLVKENGEAGEEGFPDAKPYDESMDDDEDFPDAKPNAESDDDGFPDAKPAPDSEGEDFPDAKPSPDSEDEDGVGRPAQNPLQSNVKPDKGVVDLTAPESRSNRRQGNSEGEYMMSGANTTGIGAATIRSRRHVSAHERRLLKKGNDPLAIAPTDSADDNRTDSADDTGSLASGVLTPRSKQQQLPRGKRTKAKRAAAKYAGQDEEDRELALKLLGVKVGEEAKAADISAKIAKAEQARKDKERRRQQHMKKLIDEEKKRNANAIDDNDVAPEDEEEEAVWKNELTALDTLVGKPLPGDELLAAIPICAPWTALAAYKYKAKLQPGTAKRGKAVKEVLSKWAADSKNTKAVDNKAQDVERVWPREIELFKGVKETEAVGVVPLRSCRVMMGGASGGGKDGARGKGRAARGGKGSKKQR